MIHTKETIIEELAQGNSFEFLLFYGHTNRKNQVSEICCSQWYPARFVVNGIDYPTAEHYMMAEKARLFEDINNFEKILRANSPAKAKELGRQVKNFDAALWKKHCFEIVVNGNLAKFSQNSELSEWLLNSAPKILVEASPTDLIWGIGRSTDDPAARDPFKWRGRNLLGFALTHVRDLLA